MFQCNKDGVRGRKHMLNDDEFFTNLVDTPREAKQQHKKQTYLKM